MAVITIQCISPPAYSRPPRLTIPNIGLLEEMHDAISRIPDPAELIAKLMNKAMLALAPLQKFLKMVEAIMAIKQCIEAIPRSLIPPNPQPIIDCFKALIKAVAALIQEVPPIPYIQTVIDLCRLMTDFIDGVWTFMARLDAKISNLLNVQAYAQALGDTTLIQFANCNLNHTIAPLLRMLDLLTLVSPLLNVLLSVILRLIPSPQAHKAANQCLEAASSFTTARDQLSNIDVSVVGFPRLTSMLEGMYSTREALRFVESFLCPIVGEEAEIVHRGMPTFNIF